MEEAIQLAGGRARFLKEPPEGGYGQKEIHENRIWLRNVHQMLPNFSLNSTAAIKGAQETGEKFNEKWNMSEKELENWAELSAGRMKDMLRICAKTLNNKTVWFQRMLAGEEKLSADGSHESYR